MSLGAICNKKWYMHTSGTPAHACGKYSFFDFLQGFSQLVILLPIFCLVPDVRTYLSGFWGSSVAGGPFLKKVWGPHRLIKDLRPFEVSRKTDFEP